MRQRRKSGGVGCRVYNDAVTRNGDSAVRLTGARKVYGDVVAVGGIDLEIETDEFFTMLGSSGSGKTTCLRIIAGFERPDAGRVALAGRDVTDLPPERDVNTVFQDYALFPHVSVGENVGYGLKVKKVGADRSAGVSARRSRWSSSAATSSAARGSCRAVNASAWRSPALVNRPRVLLLDDARRARPEAAPADA